MLLFPNFGFIDLPLVWETGGGVFIGWEKKEVWEEKRGGRKHGCQPAAAPENAQPFSLVTGFEYKIPLSVATRVSTSRLPRQPLGKKLGHVLGVLVSYPAIPVLATKSYPTTPIFHL